MATGVLPIALGEATKTVPYVTDGEKSYRFTVAWGSQTTTDDLEGEVVDTSGSRPDRNDIEALLPAFTGTIQQTPPAFSAIKIDGKRAYAEARAGRDVVLEPRDVEIEAFSLVDMPDEDHAIFEVTCGKGTYVRALARDMGQALGCFGHTRDLRRTFVEPFEESDCVSLDALLELEGDHAALDELLISPLQAMDGFPEIRVHEDEARRLRLGNPIILRGRDAPVEEADACAVYKGQLIAIGDVEAGEFRPRRVLLPS